MRASEAGIAAANQSVMVSSLEADGVNKICGTIFTFLSRGHLWDVSRIRNTQVALRQGAWLASRRASTVMALACCWWFVLEEQELTMMCLEGLQDESKTQMVVFPSPAELCSQPSPTFLIPSDRLGSHKAAGSATGLQRDPACAAEGCSALPSPCPTGGHPSCWAAGIFWRMGRG